MSLFNASLQPALDSNGNPINGATWNFYVSGTSTPQAVFADSVFTTSLGASVSANPSGRFPIVFFNDGLVYRAVLKDGIGATITDVDPANTTIVFLQNGVGAVTRTVQNKLLDFVSVKDFGALGNSVHDDTAAFQAAVDSIGIYGGTIFVPAGVYIITSTVTIGIKNGVKFVGQGITDTVLDFRPTANGTMFSFGGGVGPTYNCGMSDLRIFATDTTYAKTAIHLVDCSRFTIQGCEISGAGDNGSYSYWFGGTGGSYGIKVEGRDLFHVYESNIFAQRPLQLRPNPNHTISADTFKIMRNMFYGSNGTGLHATPYPLIEIIGKTQAGSTYEFLMQNTSIRDNNFIGGGYMILWNDATNASQSNDLDIGYNRAEQSHDLTVEEIYLASNIRTVSVTHWYGGLKDSSTKPGFKFRNIKSLILNAWSFVGTDVTKVALDVDGSVENIVGIGVELAPGPLVNLTNLHKIQWSPTYPSSNLPNNFILQTGTSTATTTITNVWQTGDLITVANNATSIIGTNALVGFVLISNSVGTSAIYALTGSNNLAQEISDPSGQYSPTLGSAGVTNLTYSGGNYVIENKTGGTMKYRITILGPGSIGF